MSSRIDDRALPLTEITAFKPTPDLCERMLTVMTECWNGKPLTDEVENCSFIATYMTFYLGRGLQDDFIECGYRLKEENVTAEVIAGWSSDFMPKAYEDQLFVVVNNCLLVMLCAKPVTDVSYKTWATNRAKAIFQLYSKTFPADGFQYLVSQEWASIVSLLMQHSQPLRVDVVLFAVRMAHGTSKYKRAYAYTATMLKYARLTTIVLTRLYITSGPGKQILFDPYLAPDRFYWITALKALNSFPEELRPYAGIMADMETAALLGGKQLHTIAYIALEVGQRKQPSLENFYHPVVPHTEVLQALINKYFPSEEIEYPIEETPEEADIGLLKVKPMSTVFGRRWASVTSTFSSLAPLRKELHAQVEAMRKVVELPPEVDLSVTQEAPGTSGTQRAVVMRPLEKPSVESKEVKSKPGEESTEQEGKPRPEPST